MAGRKFAKKRGWSEAFVASAGCGNIAAAIETAIALPSLGRRGSLPVCNILTAFRTV
jgi:hypothetical protein